MLNTYQPVNVCRCLLIALALFITGCSSDQESNQAAIQSHIKRSNAYQLNGQYRAAIIEARNAIKKRPSNDAGYIRLSNILLEIGNYKDASKTLEAMPKPSNNSLLLLAHIYMLQGKIISTEKTLAQYIKQNGDQNHVDFLLLKNQIHTINEGEQASYAQIKKIAEQFPDHLQAQNQLIKNLIAQQQLSLAEEQVNKTLDKKPLAIDTIYLAAQVAYQKNDLEEAEKQLTNALTALPETELLTPTKAKVLKQLSSVLTELGRTSEALAYSRLLAKANEEANESKTRLADALKQLQSGKIDEARVLLESLTRDYPNNELASVYLGMINYQQGNLEDADKLFSSHIDPETAHPQLIQTSAMAKLRLDKTDEAFAILETALKAYPENQQLLTIYGISALNNEEKQQQGLLALNKAFAMSPDDTNLTLPLANYYLENEKVEDGLSLLEKGLKTSPDDINLLASYARAQLLSDNPIKADQVISNLLSKQSANYQVLNLGARYALYTKKPDLAIKRYQQSLAIEPENIEALSNLAALSIDNKDYNLALDYYRTLINKYRDNIKAYKGIITVHELLGRPSQGLNELKALSEKPNEVHSTAAAVLAEYYLRKNQLEQSAAYLTAAKIKPVHLNYLQAIESSLLYQRAQQAAQNKNWQMAKKRLMEAISISPGNEQLYAALITVEINTKQFDEAKQLIQSATEQFPASPMPILANAQMFIASNNQPAAVDALLKGWEKIKSPVIAERLFPLLKTDQTAQNKLIEEWRASEPTSHRPLLVAAMQAQEKLDKNRAIKLYEQASALSPDNAAILNNLAWLYFETEHPAAELTAKQAAEIAPGNPAILDTYGWILVKNGKVKQGQTLLKQAVDLAPDNQEIQEHYRYSLTNMQQ